MRSVLFSYLGEKKHTLLLWMGIELIFVILLSLYRVPSEYYWYPVLLSTVLVLAGGGISFATYYRKHRDRERMLMHVDATLEDLPEPENLTERDYRNLLMAVSDARREEMTRYDAKMGEMYEYITLWAHQMKTPITAMGLVVQQTDGEEQETLEQQLFEMDRYVDTLLQYLKLDTMNQDLVFREDSVENIVREGIRYYSKIFILKHLAVETGDLTMVVVTDEKWLLFCLKQILSNALKYTSEGRISIYTTDGNKLVVQDTGIGIAAEDLPRIFDKGFTGYNGRRDKKATGIGLYLTKKILDKMGHSITVESEPGVGTIVTIGFTGQDRSGRCRTQ